jgi:sporulation protein YlmC with PRC-barrel domain
MVLSRLRKLRIENTAALRAAGNRKGEHTMLREVTGLHGVVLHAHDGQIGKVEDLLFDDEQWTVRYLVVNTGIWLFGRKVLIAPVALGLLEWDRHVLNVNLTRDQVERSPGVNTDEPVSRQWEQEYYDYHAFPYYWGGMGVNSNPWYPSALLNATAPEVDPEDVSRADPDLRSTKEVTGYGIVAPNGILGHVEDFLLDDETWNIRYLAVDTRDFWPGKKVLLPPNWIEAVNWPDRTMTVDVTRSQVEGSPVWEPHAKISAAVEGELSRYYAQRQRQVVSGI